MLGIYAIAAGRARASGAAHGFSLVELMIGLAILAFLLMMGVPAFGTFLQNAKLRAAAENFYAGLQTARAEAVTRNLPVQFILTTDSGVAGNVATTNLSTSGGNWIVRVQDPISLAYTFIEGRPAAEGSGQRGTTTVSVSSTDSSITFNGFGATTLGATATLAFTNPNGGACAPAGPMRCLNIAVSVGGQSRLCDPAVTATGDTRKC